MPKKTTEVISEMEKIVKQFPDRLVPFSMGQVVEAEVISVSKHRILVDVAGVALGMVPEREFSYDIDDLNLGDKVQGYVLLTENREGYVIISLKRADKERVWGRLAEKSDSQEAIKVKVMSANRGGLIVDFGGIEGFVPISQLSSDTIGKDEGNRLIGKLRSMIGLTLKVKIVSLDKNANKLILSQKSAGDEKQEELAGKVKVGLTTKGEITGIVDFGMFVKISIPDSQATMEGLVHISEISWDRIENLSSHYSVGEKVEIMVLSNKDGRLSFSIKRLTPDPWTKAGDKYKEGEVVEGEVTRVTPFGAFVKLPGNLDALVHVSEMGKDIEDPKEILSQGQKYSFKILNIDSEARKISLKLQKSKEKKTSKATAKK